MAGSQDDIFSFESEGDILIVTPVRDFMTVRDSDLRDAYNETYRRLTMESHRHLIIDFSHLDYFGSTFVGIMLRLARKTSDGNGVTVLCHLRDEVRSILKQLMLLESDAADKFWKRAQTREIAIEWLQTEYPQAT